MRDIIAVSVAIAFFATAAAYVRACGRVVGAEQIAPGAAAELQVSGGIGDGVPAR